MIYEQFKRYEFDIQEFYSKENLTWSFSNVICLHPKFNLLILALTEWLIDCVTIRMHTQSILPYSHPMNG